MTLLPLRVVLRFWDLLVLKGGDVLVTCCVGMLAALRPFLMFMGEEEIYRFLEFVKMRLGRLERRPSARGRRESISWNASGCSPLTRR